MDNFVKKLNTIFDRNAKVAACSTKEVSIGTCHIRIEYITREFDRLRTGKLVEKNKEGELVPQRRYKLTTPYNLKRKHIAALIKDWLARGLSVAYVHNMISIFRVFASWIGKPNLIEATVDALPDPEYKRRIQAATKDRSWGGCGIDTAKILAEIEKDEPRVGMVLRLMLVFGLRLKEASLLRPWLADQQVMLDICRGTKNGRHRTHKISTTDERSILEAAKLLVSGRNGCLIPRGQSYKSWQDHIYYVMGTYDITRRKCGTTPHGLRHEKLHLVYKQNAGVPCPIKGGEPGAVSSEEDQFARKQVAEVAGHSRSNVSSAYLGAVLRTKKKGGGTSNPPLMAGVSHPG